MVFGRETKLNEHGSFKMRADKRYDIIQYNKAINSNFNWNKFDNYRPDMDIKLWSKEINLIITDLI